MDHNWTQDFHLTGRLENLPYVTSIQGYKCTRCGEKISLPDCPKKTCRVLMSLGCSGEIRREKAPWKAPIKDRTPTKVDYPAKKQRK